MPLIIIQKNLLWGESSLSGGLAKLRQTVDYTDGEIIAREKK